MSPLGSQFPSILKRLWRQSDESTREDRHCDALGEATCHQQFDTHEGPYWICSQTGQLSRDHVAEPDDLIDHYDDRWTKRIDPEQQRKDDVAVAKWGRWLERFEPWRGDGSLFEVGSGKGQLLKAAVESGWHAIGNEISPVAAEHAEAYAGVPVRVGAIEDIALEPEQYDVFLLNNVFEHLRCPSSVMANISQSLKPGGVLFIQTLCAQSMSMWWNSHGWTYFGKGHLFIPTLTSMHIYCDRVGLTPLTIKTHGFRSQTGGTHGEVGAVRKCMDKLVSNFAGRMKLGHRMEAILQKSK